MPANGLLLCFACGTALGMDMCHKLPLWAASEHSMAFDWIALVDHQSIPLIPQEERLTSILLLEGM